jgi:hypothetical protein
LRRRVACAKQDHLPLFHRIASPGLHAHRSADGLRCCHKYETTCFYFHPNRYLCSDQPPHFDPHPNRYPCSDKNLHAYPVCANPPGKRGNLHSSCQ